MKISLNTIRYYRDMYQWSGDPAPNGVDDLLVKIGAQLGGVEETTDFGSKYDGAVVVRVANVEKHPNADKLNICMIDDGGVVPDLARDENGYVQVVCGAPNVRAGLLVVWLPPGSTVPESVGKDPFVLEARELRGVVSNGMLASARELALGDSHDGILEITLDADGQITPGTAFADAYQLRGDVVIDIENKMFTHRPDCFGSLGVAREIAGIQRMPFTSPDWYRSDANIPTVEADALPLEVRNELPDLVRRFCAVTMRNVKVGPSPLWLQIDLAKVGSRSINNIVDYTNYFMLLTGQPLHAYDYDKVKALDGNSESATIVVRNPHEGEKITLLNGKEIEPRAEAIVIATATTLIGVGGAMGGADTEVDENTKNIILEAANFDMYSIRRTSMAHGLFTDAVSRFNKGQSPLQNRAVIAKIVDEIRQFAGGKVASELIDDVHLPVEVLERNSLHAPVEITSGFVNDRLGLELSAEEMTVLLTNVEFDVAVDGDNLLVKAPFWRTDIEIPEDVVEEVGRLYGYDHLPLNLPWHDLTPPHKDALIETKSAIRAVLSKAGANELLTYSFVHGKLLEKVGQSPDQAFKLSNALSPDLQYYRLSLTPSLLDKIHANVKAGYDKFALFEIGKVHAKGELNDEGVPTEFNRLAFVFAADQKAAKQYDGAAFYQARKYLDTLLDAFGLGDEVVIEPLESKTYVGTAQTKITQYDTKRTAVIRLGDVVLGEIGEYKASVQKQLKLPAFSAGFELDISVLSDKRKKMQPYTPLPRFPKVEQDICLKVAADMPYQQLYGFVAAKLAASQSENALYSLTPVDIYQRPDDTEHKQITLRLSIASYEKTLRDIEVAGLLDGVAATAKEELSAERI